MKLYADEPGHEVVRGLADPIVSQLVRVEVPSALWRKARDGAISEEHALDLTGAFEADYFGVGAGSRFVIVGLVPEVLEEAAARARERALRTLDAIQLASAILARDVESGCSVFACFDDQLRDAAEAEGFEVVPPRSHTSGG